MRLEVRKGKPGEPYAIGSVLGWCLNSSAHGRCMSDNVMSNFISINETKAASHMRLFRDYGKLRTTVLTPLDYLSKINWF